MSEMKTRKNALEPRYSTIINNITIKESHHDLYIHFEKTYDLK